MPKDRQKRQQYLIENHQKMEGKFSRQMCLVTGPVLKNSWILIRIWIRIRFVLRDWIRIWIHACRSCSIPVNHKVICLLKKTC